MTQNKKQKINICIEEAVGTGLYQDPRCHYYLSAEEEFMYLKKNDTEAKEILLLSNLFFISKIALSFSNTRLLLSDLIQEGMLGFLAAIDNFDINKNYRLRTYASYYVKKYIHRYINNSYGLVRLPSYVVEKNYAIKKVTDEYKKSYGFAPSDEELSDFTGIKIDDIRKIRSSISNFEVISLDRTILKEATQSKDYQNCLYNIIDNRNEYEVDKKHYSDLIDSINKALKFLNRREKEVLILRYGLLDGQYKSQKKVADILNLSDVRVGQIERKSLKKIIENEFLKNDLKKFL